MGGSVGQMWSLPLRISVRTLGDSKDKQLSYFVKVRTANLGLQAEKSTERSFSIYFKLATMRVDGQYAPLEK